jgi:cyclophilin family peptidyl-prolyl cis-trans isomerase
MGRNDPGMMQFVDWDGNGRAAAMAAAATGFGGNNQVYMDIVVANRTEQTMRLVFQLFEQTPLAFYNFRALATHEHPGLGASGFQLSYRRSPIHAIARGQYLEGGDITLGDGRGGDSIFGTQGFKDEPYGLRLRHDAAGLLCMANGQLADSTSGRHDNRSIFRVTLGPTPEFDGRQVVIGRLVSGALHLETLGALPCDAQGRPTRRVSIVECGLIPGWANLPTPGLVSLAGEGSEATLGGVSQKAHELRSSVADTVRDAMARGGGGSGGIGGGGGGGQQKREAPSGGATEDEAERKQARTVPGPRAGAMMGLHIEGLDYDSDSDEESEEEGAGA